MVMAMYTSVKKLLPYHGWSLAEHGLGTGPVTPSHMYQKRNYL